ncbi:hypothetical protein Tco_0418795 [Tanacetum coccineum]
MKLLPNVTFNETPPPPKTSPLEDDELVEEEAIEVSKTKPLGNDLEDISLENNQIVNIKESKTHPLENVIEANRSASPQPKLEYCTAVKISPPKDAETPVESPIPISPSSSVGSSSPFRSTTPPPDYPFDKSILDNSLWIIPQPLGSEPVPEKPNESDAC